ncbi:MULTISPECIES: hypothetical protein [unclassified Pseudofrankia]|uniref:hypothetical protein n=1 Tax=unclassified Pseudofrankia TaxID=2994372 RepID=UPI000B0C3EEC|nr:MULTISPECIES: hypothetical protein [unclassified Pseudofrankia]MDT3441632.1 hypothetical protein [Pseudofrankia sp. BMG5.37]
MTVLPRSNVNRAQAKMGISRTVPASAELMRLYADYLTEREVFLADPGPPLRGRCRLTGCAVATRRLGTSGRGLCTRRRERWQQGGRPDPHAWAATFGLFTTEIVAQRDLIKDGWQVNYFTFRLTQPPGDSMTSVT